MMKDGGCQELHINQVTMRLKRQEGRDKITPCPKLISSKKQLLPEILAWNHGGFGHQSGRLATLASR
jgi:hypothetical protein